MRGNPNYLPSTFEERGTAVPFTTPLLTQARVRKNERGKLELSVPRFADGPGSLVVPWPSVPEIVRLSGHDQALHEAVAAGNLADPHAIRLAALQVASGGLAGPETARAAAQALRADEEYKAFTNVLLIATTVTSMSDDSSPEAIQALVQGVGTPDGQRRVRGGLRSIAAALEIGPDELDERLDRLSLNIAPVGLRAAPRRGRLRALARRLTEFRDSMQSLAQSSEAIDTADCAGFCAVIADCTLQIAVARLAEFDALLGDRRRLLARWDAAFAASDRLVQRLAWLLDGWDFVAEMWFTALAQSSDLSRVPALHAIFSLLPMIPREELKRAGFLPQETAIVSLRGRRWVRGLEDWRTGEQVKPMVMRILAANAYAI
jgi:hypothetical protein